MLYFYFAVYVSIYVVGVVSTIAGNGRHKGWQDGVGTNAMFYCPYALAWDDDGTLLVTQWHGIRKITFMSSDSSPSLSSSSSSSSSLF